MQPQRSGVSRHPLLMPTHQDEQPFDTLTALLHPGQVLTKVSDGAEQELISVTIHKIIQGWDSELIETGVKHRRILGLSNEVKKEGKGTGPPTPRITNMKREVIQLTNLFGRRRSKQKGRLPGEMLVKGQLKRLKRRPRQTPENERKIPIWWLYLPLRTEHLETPEHPRDHCIEGPCQSKRKHD